MAPLVGRDVKLAFNGGVQSPRVLAVAAASRYLSLRARNTGFTSPAPLIGVPV